MALGSWIEARRKLERGEERDTNHFLHTVTLNSGIYMSARIIPKLCYFGLHLSMLIINPSSFLLYFSTLFLPAPLFKEEQVLPFSRGGKSK